MAAQGVGWWRAAQGWVCRGWGSRGCQPVGISGRRWWWWWCVCVHRERHKTWQRGEIVESEESDIWSPPSLFLSYSSSQVNDEKCRSAFQLGDCKKKTYKENIIAWDHISQGEAELSYKHTRPGNLQFPMTETSGCHVLSVEASFSFKNLSPHPSVKRSRGSVVTWGHFLCFSFCFDVIGYNFVSCVSTMFHRKLTM